MSRHKARRAESWVAAAVGELMARDRGPVVAPGMREGWLVFVKDAAGWAVILGPDGGPWSSLEEANARRLEEARETGAQTWAARCDVPELSEAEREAVNLAGIAAQVFAGEEDRPGCPFHTKPAPGCGWCGPLGEVRE